MTERPENVELWDAAAAGDVERMQVLLAEGADPNAASSPEGLTPLMFAAREGRSEAVRLLLRHGADVQARVPIQPRGGWPEFETALTLAVGFSDERTDGHRSNVQDQRAEAVKLLIEAGADLGPRRNTGRCDHEYDACGETPLHIAAGAKRIELVRLLISAGARVNARNCRCATPLHWACDSWAFESDAVEFERQLATVRTLIEAGADVNYRDKKGRTPLSIAHEVGLGELERVLLEAGAT